MNAMPSGWFPNPVKAEEEVYWDGERWTGESRRLGDIAAESKTGSSEDNLGSPTSEEGAESTEARSTTASTSLRKRRKLGTKGRLIIAAAAVGLVVAASGTTVSLISAHNEQVAEQQLSREKAAKAAADEAAAEKQASDDAARAVRKATVAEIEASVKKMAENYATKGVIDGPIIGVSCDPVNGGSADDLSDKTTAFDCFVANKDNGDGTQSGYFFNSTVNWTTGSYTYGLGKSNGGG
jgi:hypothetical protein